MNIIYVLFQYLDVNHSAMEGMSERAYAAHSGLSRGATQNARKNGRLPVTIETAILQRVLETHV